MHLLIYFINFKRLVPRDVIRSRFHTNDPNYGRSMNHSSPSPAYFASEQMVTDVSSHLVYLGHWRPWSRIGIIVGWRKRAHVQFPRSPTDSPLISFPPWRRSAFRAQSNPPSGSPEMRTSMRGSLASSFFLPGVTTVYRYFREKLEA